VKIIQAIAGPALYPNCVVVCLGALCSQAIMNLGIALVEPNFLTLRVSLEANRMIAQQEAMRLDMIVINNSMHLLLIPSSHYCKFD
jgi:hypothetical protein